MDGISKIQIKVIADLEFRKKYYFTIDDIKDLFKDQRQRINALYSLKKKGRIVKLNKKKYFLVPIKARTGSWTDNPFIIADELFDGKDYFIVGWYAAYYWKLTDQVPMQVDINTTRRQGKITLLNMRWVFHRTSKKRIKEAIVQTVEGHPFWIMSKEQTAKWLKSRK
jgi:predicted transcriptional regulator of viral defense system